MNIKFKRTASIEKKEKIFCNIINVFTVTSNYSNFAEYVVSIS